MFGWRVVRIVGRSMEPVLEHGDYAVVRAGHDRRWREGDIVLAEHPQRGAIIKYLGAESDGSYRLWSPGPHAPDPSELGTVASEDIHGRLIWRVSPHGISRPGRVVQE